MSGFYECLQINLELLVVQDSFDKLSQRSILVRVRIGPRGVHFSFAGSLFHVGDHAFRFAWQGADERLVQKIFSVEIRQLMSDAAPLFGPQLFRPGAGAKGEDKRRGQE